MAVLAQRLEAQLLAGPRPRDPVAVVGRMLAVQAQDGRGARLAVRARSTGLTAADVDRALTDDRSLLITWLNRGTLHLVRTEDYPWLQALTAPRLATGVARRLGQEGVSPAAADRAVAAIERILTEEGPLDRNRLRDQLRSEGAPVQGQAFVQLLALAAIRGLTVRGPMSGKQHQVVLVRDWIGEPKPVDRTCALAE
ncbi:MAG TPA: crosslink repair DNA glycosylase YcaQ family protein, partial [Gaiellaceae bacterium]|nr:crosslink repair DNA glycosylase YcaQ family protein [Gaiellaceae bacterium]